MRMVDLINKKREGYSLSKEEIYYWINGYVNNQIPDYQVSALCMAIVFNGMNDEETTNLTIAMMNSGDTVDLSSIDGVKVDKHSTGGVGDKVTLVLGAMVASCGATFAKLSGRGLGHTGGTLDKLESIPGLITNLGEQRFISQVKNLGIAVACQSESLVPADKKIYALRDVSGTVQSLPLIASSVMSKKLASSADTILLDVTVGYGAFMKDIIQARKLATLMIKIGRSYSRDTRAVLTNMNEPLGFAVGNNLEVKEAVNALQGKGPEDLMEVCYTCGSVILLQSGIVKTMEEGKERLQKSIEDGSAFALFCKMVEAQGGDVSYILNTDKFIKAKNIITIRSTQQGYVHEVNAFDIGNCSMALGGGRSKKEDVIDMSAGIVLNKKVGDCVNINEVLCYLHTNKSIDEIKQIIDDVRNSFVIQEHHINRQKVILEIIL